MQPEMQAAEKLLADYAQALNTANAAAIPSFYTQDGVFLPDGYRQLAVADLKKSGSSYLQRSNFRISYEIKNVVAENGYVFVDAQAKTTSHDPATRLEKNLNSLDFFVLRKEGAEWKIFRYLFNHVRAQ
jgi:ketosteroid isomerase-like protein